jgi:hypothetical protein
MARASSTDVLNRLFQVVYRSLPMYLADAWPWSDDRSERNRRETETLRNIIHDQREMARRLAELLQDRRGALDMGDFPMEFTDTQFLALDFLIPELIHYQRQDVQSIDECVAQLSHDPQARSLAEEALGAERAHLEALEELLKLPA